MSNTVLQTLSDDGVLLLTLNRPDKKNAFNREQWAAFRDAINEARENPEVACVVVTGAGDDFSSGVDLSDFASEDAEHPFESCARAVADFDKPLIAAAKGVAIGGGATLLLHCDVIYVGESLRMRFPFTNLGLVPEFGSSYTLQAVIGSRKAAELMYTAEWIDAQRALDTGIVTGICSDEGVLDQALVKAREIARWPISSLVATKQMMRRVHLEGIHAAIDAEQEGMMRLAGSPENIEAVMAFIEKREPDFKQFRKK